MENSKLYKLQNKRSSLGRNVGVLDFLIDFYQKKEADSAFYSGETSLEVKCREHKIHTLSEDISNKKSSEEFDFLLQYADEIRKLELSDTYVKLIKYLCVHYHSLNTKSKKLFLLHVSNVLRISEDLELIETILFNYSFLIKDIPLSPRLKDKIFNTNFSITYDYSKGEEKYLIFDLQNEEKLALTILLNNQDLYSKLKDNPELYGIFCNNFICDLEKYKVFFNKFLSYFSLPLIHYVHNGGGNILKRIEFEKQYISNLNKTPLVSIIVSSYNSQDTIEYAVNSLLNQSYKNIELLICDDCSQDNTFSILKKMELQDNRIRLYKSVSNQGTYNIRNEMIKLAKGEYITFHDSDDLSMPTRISEQVKILNNYDNIVLCTSQWIRLEPNGKLIYFFDGKLNRFCAVSSMFRKGIFEKIGFFRNSLVAADTDFYEKVINFYGRESVYKLDKPLILGLWGEGSLTKQKNLVAGNSGFVAEKRRTFSDICARQRLLGKDIISDEYIDYVLNKHNIFKENFGVLK